MRARITITIQKRTQPEWLVWVLVMMPFLFGTLNELLGLPWAIHYLMDIAWVALVLMMVRFEQFNQTRQVRELSLWILVFLVVEGLVYIVQFQSPLYFLWGVRNNFRLYAAFLAFAVFLTKTDVETYFRVFDKLFWLNVVVSLIQWLALGLEQDHLGGIFGTEKGCNGYTNIFFLIVVARSVLFYMEKRESARKCIAKCGAALLVAALAELKAFFVEFVILIILAVLVTNFTWRKFWVILGGFAAVVAGAALLAVYFPGYAGWFRMEYILESLTSSSGYTSSGDLNRLNAIPQINELWLKGWGQRMFGLGLGNCETSNVAMLNTPFFEKYGNMHYTWISYAMMYLECGWVGLIFYIGFFVLTYFEIRKTEKNSQGIAKIYCRLARILAVLCIVIAVYNSSLRTEAGYMTYFVLAVPFALRRDRYSTAGTEAGKQWD